MFKYRIKFESASILRNRPLETEDGNFINLDKVIADLDNTYSYFVNIFNNKGVDLGVLRLRKRQIPNFPMQ